MERELLEKMLKDAQLSPEEEAQLDACWQARHSRQSL